MKSNLFVLLLCVLFFVSCTNPLYKPEGRKDSSLAGKRDNTAVIITFTTDPYGTNKSRTVVADFGNQITKWEVKISREGDSQTSEANEGTVTFKNIQTGNWNVNITGRNNSDAVIASGNKDITVGNENNEFNIPITFKQAGTGSLSLTFEFPESTGISSVSTAIAGSSYNADITQNGDNKTAVFNIASIQSGSYYLNFIFKKGEEILGEYREAVNIWDNTLSDKFLGVGDGGNVTLVDKRVFTENDFGYRNANLLSLTIDGKELTPGFTSLNYSYTFYTNLSQVKFKAVQSIAHQNIKYTINENYTGISSGVENNLALAGDETTLKILVISPNRTNEKVYEIRVFKDTTAPAEVTNLRTATGDNSVTLNWTKSAGDGAGAGFKEYRIYQGAELKNTLTDISTQTSTISGLTSGTQYSFTIKTVDNLGNESSGVSINATPLDLAKSIELEKVPQGLNFTMQGKSISLSPFEMGKYEVTNKLYKTVTDWAADNGYTFPYTISVSDNRPANYTIWRDCIIWCNAYTEWYNATQNPDIPLTLVYFSDASFTTPLKTHTGREPVQISVQIPVLSIIPMSTGMEQVSDCRQRPSGNLQPAEVHRLLKRTLHGIIFMQEAAV